MRTLTPGSTGALRQHTVAEAVARGHEIAALVRDRARDTFSEAAEIVRGRRPRPLLSHPPSSVAMLVLCAPGSPSPRRPNTFLKQGTRNLVAAMSRQGRPSVGMFSEPRAAARRPRELVSPPPLHTSTT